ncbi:MAG TPA: NAD-dependent epimerase/dehydratase family protein [Capsulimonadaceae bacterium]|jgi:nucleoside-diphosphate-sugar epimerase
MKLKVLFIGGTGIISSACSKLAIERNAELYLLRRGVSTRDVPEGAITLNGDIRDPESAKAAIGDRKFDVVVNWIGFTPEHIAADIALFTGRTKQYVFISSASAYQTPPDSLPVTESCVLDNPYWAYSRNKIACEELLVKTFQESRFPITIVRPSHTYDQTLLPMDGGYTVIDRMRRGKKVIVHGDGTSLWTITNHRDFAKGFVGLLGNRLAIGESFHITTDESYTWNKIFEIYADAAGAKADIVHVPSELIAAYDENWGAGLLGDKAHSMVFDNAKIKRLVPAFKATVPLHQGAKETLAWYDADPARQVVDEQTNELIDRILNAYKKAWPKK